MKTIARWAVALLLIANAGSALAAETDPPINPAQARMYWRWVGLDNQPEQDCPPAEGWQVERLFNDPQLPLPPGLAPYCLYELPPGVLVTGALINNLRSLVPAQLSIVQPDQMAVAAEAEGQLPPRLFNELSAHFLEQAGQSTSELTFPGGDNVRLTLLDTQPTGGDPELFTNYTAAHGYTLATLTERLLCNGVGGDCAADVRTRLALPNVCFNNRRNLPNCRNPQNGGWFGSQVELARAIRSEVVDWVVTTSPAPLPAEQQHLILNLSLGWNARYGGNQPFNAMPPPVAAVYAALLDARCRGALPVASAGNQHGGPSEPGGPVLPARWEQRPAPTFNQCVNQLEAGAYVPPWAFPGLGVTDTRTLVVAAGGVRFDDEIIFNGRPNGGEPRLVAFADHAATESLAIPNTPTITLTGTSVASTVVSAAAAAAWRFSNGLDTISVVEALADSGTDLGRPADFCRGGMGGNPCPAPAPTVKRVAVCATIECIDNGNCSGPYGSCPTLTPLDLSGVFLDDIVETADLSKLTATLTDPDCGAITTHYDPNGPVPANPCLSRQFHGVNALPALDPQPGDLPCPNCFGQQDLARANEQLASDSAGPQAGLSGTSTLYYEIDPQLIDTFTDVTLLCGTDAFVLPFTQLNPLALGAVTNVECSDTTPVQLLLRDSEGRTHISPVLSLDD